MKQILTLILLSAAMLFSANCNADTTQNNVPSPKIPTGKISGSIDCTSLVNWDQIIEEIKVEKPKTIEDFFNTCDTAFTSPNKPYHDKIKLTLFNDTFEKILMTDSGRRRNYTFTDVPFGEYMLKIEVEHYKPFKNKPIQPVLQTVPLILNESEYNNYTHHELVKLEPFAVNVSGQILNEEGKPIPYAEVTASYPLGPECGDHESPVWKLTADSQGKYTIYGFGNPVNPFFGAGFLIRPGEGEIKFGYGGTIDLSAAAKGYVKSKPSRKLLLTENVLHASRLFLDVFKHFEKVKEMPEMVENKKLIYPKSVGNTITGYNLVLQKSPPYGTIEGRVSGDAKKDLYNEVDLFIKKDLNNEKDIWSIFFHESVSTEYSDKNWYKDCKVSLYSNDSLISVCALDSQYCYRFNKLPYGNYRLITEIANCPSYIRGETQTAVECQSLHLTPEKPVVNIYQSPAIRLIRVKGRITDAEKNPVVNATVSSYPDQVTSDSNGCYELCLTPDILRILATPPSEKYDADVDIQVKADGLKTQYISLSVANRCISALKQYYYEKTKAKSNQVIHLNREKLYQCDQTQTIHDINFILHQKIEKVE